MEKDPSIVARLAADLEDENWRFRTFVKMGHGLSRAKMNALAERLGRAAEAQMDCTTCGACCRDNCVPLSPEEQDRLADKLGLLVGDFAEQFMTLDDDGEPAMEATPCRFLDGTRCSVYECRPDACRGYPYIGGDVATRMLGILERAGTCPIVFEMLEQLKQATGFGRYR
jgi:uncharacterized protein